MSYFFSDFCKSPTAFVRFAVNLVGCIAVPGQASLGIGKRGDWLPFELSQMLLLAQQVNPFRLAHLW